MEFTLSTTSHYCDVPDRRNELAKFGFTFEYDEKYRHHRVVDIGKIEINSLEELMKFDEQWGPLIIEKGSIEIYDDYRE